MSPVARNLTLSAAVASCFIQIGAQLFALVVIVGTVVKAPPRSFAIFQGEYGYDSRAFWEIVPTVTIALFVIALALNWKTARRNVILLALGLFIAAGASAGILLEPSFDEMIATGYRDAIDPVLLTRASRWYMLDWLVWGLSLSSGLVLLLALTRPDATAR